MLKTNVYNRIRCLSDERFEKCVDSTKADILFNRIDYNVVSITFDGQATFTSRLERAKIKKIKLFNWFSEHEGEYVRSYNNNITCARNIVRTNTRESQVYEMIWAMSLWKWRKNKNRPNCTRSANDIFYIGQCSTLHNNGNDNSKCIRCVKKRMKNPRVAFFCSNVIRFAWDIIIVHTYKQWRRIRKILLGRVKNVAALNILSALHSEDGFKVDILFRAVVHLINCCIYSYI